MNANGIELLLVLAAVLGGTVALKVVVRRRGSRAFRLGAHLMRPHQ